MANRPEGGGISRRSLLRTAGLGAGAVAVGRAMPGRAAVAGTGAAASAVSGGAGALSEPLMLARVWATKKSIQKLVGFDDTHVVYPDGSVQYLLWPGDLAKLRATGLRHEIQVADLVAHDRMVAAKAKAAPALVDPQPGQTATNDYRHYADFETHLKALAAKYPTQARVFALPFKTLEKRTVWAIEIATDVNRRDGRPVFYMDGCHHAREWPAAEVPTMWAHDLLDNYSKDPRIKAIVDNVRTILVPVVNADGFNYSREFPADDGNKVSNPVLGGDGGSAVVAGGQGQYVRKNRRALVSTHLGDGTTDTQQEKPKGYDAFLTGIDPNRNYAYAWGDDQAGSSANMLDQTYRGTDPFSEAESKNVSYLLRTHHPVAMITHHTSGDLVLWAWGDTQADAYDNDLLEGFGRAMAVYNGYEAKKSIGLYVTTGTTSDYAYGVFGSIGYTFEHAGDSFHPPYPATVPAMYARNREAFILLNMEICLTPGQRVDNPQPANVQAKLDAKGYEGGLNHAIITGRTVNAAGQGVPGVVKLFKAFDTLLWKNGNGNNPLGQAAYREYIETSMETGPDGRFEYHVNPSTRPFLLIEDEREAYQLAVQGKASGQGISRSVVIDRGEILNLGNIVVA